MNWIVIDPKTQEGKCDRCAKSMELRFPMDAKKFIAQARAFELEHENCVALGEPVTDTRRPTVLHRP